eukprot:XP_027326350.1 pericentrin-like isoform X1 [Anas platyrhynchos]
MVQDLGMDFEPSRRNVEIDITRAPESSRQEMERIMDQKMAVLRNQLEVSQNIAPPLEEQANTQTSLQAISEKLHNLQVCLKNLEVSREQDLQILREEMEDRITKAKKSWTKDCLIEMENKLENIVDIVDINTTRALESTQQKAEKILSEKVAVLQNQLEVSQNVYREELILLENKLENIVDIVDINITRALESTQQKAEKILSEKLTEFQNQLEVSQNVYREELISLESKLENIVDIVDINTTRALESTQQKAEKILSEKLAVFQNQLEVSQNVYREELILLESKLERTVDINTTRALESTQQNAEKILSEKLTEFQNQLEVSQNVYREELISLESKLEDIVDIVDIDITRALESTQQKAEKILSEKLTEFQNQLEVSQNVYREELISLESKLGEQGCPQG